MNNAVKFLQTNSEKYMNSNMPNIKAENIRFNHWLKDLSNKNIRDLKIKDVSEGVNIILKTEKYISQTKPQKFEQQGTDFHNVKFDPERIGKPYSEIDVVYDYDFKRLAYVESTLSGIDRKRVLKYLFYLLSRNAKNNNEIYMNVFKFLSKASFHNPVLQPMYPDTTMVADPLVLLELGEMRCGQVARIAVDMFQANGFDARLVQAGGHVLAEVFFDNDWHYFDADIFGGTSVAKIDGTIPSVIKLSKQPFIIDSLLSYIEANAYTDRLTNINLPYPSYYYFSIKAYSQASNVSSYFKKLASDEEELNKYYGWNYGQTILDNDRILYDMNPYYKPLSVKFKNIDQIDEEGKKIYIVEWYPSYDGDSDLLGYRVLISDRSRGWAFESFYGDKGLEKYRSHPDGYDPSMYEKMYEIPYANIATIITKKTSVEISIEKNISYFVRIMPFDKHGEEVGIPYYFRSNELKLTN